MSFIAVPSFRCLPQRPVPVSYTHLAVIYLFYYEGYPAAEIGGILGIPTATVHTRLARGRAKLKELLGGAIYEQTI